MGRPSSEVFAFTPSLRTMLRRARNQGRSDCQRIIETLETELAGLTRRIFGDQCAIEMQFDEERQELDVYLVLEVMAQVSDPGCEVALDNARRLLDPNSEVGDELLVSLQAPLPELLGADRCNAWREAYGKALLDAFPGCHGSSPELAARIDTSQGVPPLSQSLEVVAGFLRTHAPHARAHYAGVSRDTLSEFENLGPATADLVAFHEMFGSDSSDDDLVPFKFGEPCPSPSQSLANRRQMNELARTGSFDEWAISEWWNPAWIPFIGTFEGPTLCIDTEGSFGGQPGQLLTWDPTPERVIEAPSLRVWLAWLALGIVAGLVWWDDEMGLGAEGPDDESQLWGLRQWISPGYPKFETASPACQ